MLYSKESLQDIDEAQTLYDAAMERKAEKEAAKKARWDLYQEQLSKSTPYVVGARKARGAMWYFANE